jgi:hypothetical protein
MACSENIPIRRKSNGLRWIRTSDFHRVRTPLAGDTPCFSGFTTFKDRKKMPGSQGFPEGKTEGRRASGIESEGIR